VVNRIQELAMRYLSKLGTVVSVCGYLALFVTSPSTLAQTVDISSSTSTVGQVYRYSDELPEFAPMLVVQVTDPTNASVCVGGWISTTDGQYRDFFQMVIAAKATGSRLRLAGDPNRLFPGSSDPYCYIHFAGLL